MPKQLRVFWTAAGGAGGETALHFDTGADNADINTTVQAFLTAIRSALANTTSAVADSVIRTLNSASGVLEAEEPNASPANIVGNGGTNAVPNAAQGLIRLRTGDVVGGRLLKGRIYIPGMTSSAMSPAGELTFAAVSTLTAGGAALQANPGGIYVWHRPVNGVGGLSGIVTSASAWSEFAVQRRRRA